MQLIVAIHIYQQEQDWQKAIETAKKLLTFGRPAQDAILSTVVEISE